MHCLQYTPICIFCEGLLADLPRNRIETQFTTEDTEKKHILSAMEQDRSGLKLRALCAFAVKNPAFPDFGWQIIAQPHQGEL